MLVSCRGGYEQSSGTIVQKVQDGVHQGKRVQQDDMLPMSQHSMLHLFGERHRIVVALKEKHT